MLNVEQKEYEQMNTLLYCSAKNIMLTEVQIYTKRKMFLSILYYYITTLEKLDSGLFLLKKRKK